MTRHSPLPLPLLRRALVLTSLSLAAISPAACATRPARTAPVPAPTTRLHLTGVFAPDSSRVEELAAGVTHTALHIPTGPWQIQLVEVSPRACGVELHTVKGLDHVIGRERPSAIAHRTAVAEERPVIAAVNADFFSFKQPGVSEGPQVSAGQGEAVALYNRYFGARTPVDMGVVEVIVRTVKTAALAGDTAVGVIVRVDTVAGGVDIPLDGVVLTEHAHAGAALQPSLTPGDTVRWSLHFRGTPARVKELIGGFPMLLRDGASVLDRIDTTSKFSITRHPRTAVGVRVDGTVLLVVVDGRSEASGGMSLAQLTAFMKALGARDALNLDGGGSTVLDVGDQVASHPSDKTGERAVANALLVLGPPAHQCERGAPHRSVSGSGAPPDE